MPTTTPRYERVMISLRERIAAGEFEPDGRLPSTKELVDEYRQILNVPISRGAIREAVTRLIMLGELRGEPGVGVYRVEKDGTDG